MATTQADKPVNNGVNVEALFGAAGGADQTPEAARFKWRSTGRVDQRHAQPLHH
jgi:hypothetical protein